VQVVGKMGEGMSSGPSKWEHQASIQQTIRTVRLRIGGRSKQLRVGFYVRNVTDDLIKFGVEVALITCKGNLVLGKFCNSFPNTSQRLNRSLSMYLVRAAIMDANERTN